MKAVTKRILRSLGIDIGWVRSRRSLEGFLQVLFDTYGINLAIDIGANTGQHAKALRAFGFAGRIVSFEPIPQTFAELSRNMREDPNWVGYNCALGRECAEVTMIHDSVQTDMTSLYPPASTVPDTLKRWASSDKEEIVVPMKTLDEQFADCIGNIKEPSVFLKCDTQGHDLEVLKGGLRSLGQVRIVQIEVPVVHLYKGSNSFGTIVDSLRDLGFQPCAFYPVTTFGSNATRVVEFDCIAVHATDGQSVISNISIV